MESLKSRIYQNPFLISTLLFILLSTWAISSPVGSSPDESTHLTSAWCYKNFKNSECSHVPKEIYNAGKCFIYDSEEVATCQKGVKGFEDPTSVNPPTIYIKFLSILMGDNLSLSVISMRLANALLISIFFVIFFYAISKDKRNILVYSFLVTSLPLGFYLIPSISTSSWLIILFSILIPLLITYKDGNYNSIKYILLILLILIINNSRRETLVLVGGTLLASGIYLLTVNKLFNTRKILMFFTLSILNFLFFLLLWNNTDLIKFRLEKISLFETLSRYQSLLIGNFGGWGLGSLEVSQPGLVFVLNFMIILALLFLSLKSQNLYFQASIFFNFLFISVLTIFTLYNSNLRVGEWVQPRYILPLFYSLMFLAIYDLYYSNFKSFKILVKIIMPLQVIIYSFSHFELIKRYTHGLNYYQLNLDKNPKWWWSQNIFIITPMSVLLISILSYVLLLSLVYLNLFSKKSSQNSQNF